jgi:hypothetical protein
MLLDLQSEAGGGAQALMDELQDVAIDYIITMCCEAEVLCVFV